ncbi:preprotein translocase subunit SecE [Gloeobacter kilaueensis]|uniref:preprotein translocase subunit SecE n=1 Tax=Gloeobacter kilaueensis TaxID=1416614 RepID=UPI0003F5427A|nr:preprotein translocase subunit SecE [Gloeobacter kilaueensis]
MTTEPRSTPAAKFNPRQFLAEVRGELDKVVWPDRKQVIAQSASVLLIVVAMASFIYLLDELLRWLSGLIF